MKKYICSNLIIKLTCTKQSIKILLTKLKIKFCPWKCVVICKQFSGIVSQKNIYISIEKVQVHAIVPSLLKKRPSLMYSNKTKFL